MKKVSFNEHVVVHIIPREDRAGHWAINACRFKARISKVEQAIKGCFIQKRKKIFR